MSNAGLIRDRLLLARVIPVLRLDDVRQVQTVIGGLLDAGFATIEIALTTPGAVSIIADIRAQVAPSFMVGAGTVLDREQARECIDAGADYLVSPCSVDGIVEVAHEAGCAALLGAFTPSEVNAAICQGSDIVKLFPASTGGPSHLAALRAVFPGAKFCPTGGIGADNLSAFFAAGAAAVGVGNSIIDQKALAENDRPGLASHAKRFLHLAAEAM